MIELPASIWSLTPVGFAIGVVVLVYILIATGRLIPKSSHERELAMAEKRVEDAHKRGDEWKETAHDQRAVNAVLRTQNGQLIESQKVVESFLRAASPGNLADTGGHHAGS